MIAIVAVSVLAGWAIRRKCAKVLRIRKANIRKHKASIRFKRELPGKRNASWESIKALNPNESGCTGLACR